jgi:cysteine desulfurase / selenocysteine lyase
MQDLASEFPITRTHTYLNTAAQGPWPNRTADAVRAFVERAQAPGTTLANNGNALEDHARAGLAALLGIEPHDLVFGPNTSHGLNLCTHGIDWRSGDNVVVPDTEFPSVQYALAHVPALGVEVRRVAFTGGGPSTQQIIARIDARTRAVICSAITWDTGYRADLEALGAYCAQRGCLLIVDGIHAVAAEVLDLRALRVSAFAFHGYKWLMAGFGLGVLYVAPDALNQIQPRFVGPLGVDSDVMTTQLPPTWRTGAQRFATGNGNFSAAAALSASLTLIASIGVAQICAHNHALADLLTAGIKQRLPNAHVLRSDDARHQSAIVVFSMGSTQADAALVAELAARNVIVALRPQGIRVSPHLFNSARDIETLLAALG